MTRLLTPEFLTSAIVVAAFIVTQLENRRKATSLATKVDDAATEASARIAEIHVIVNQQRTDMQAEIAQLRELAGLGPDDDIPPPKPDAC